MISSLISFVVQIPILLLQVELDPVVKSNYFCSRFSLSHKDMLKSTGVQAVEIHQTETLGPGLDSAHTSEDISPCVSVSVVEVEPNQVQLTFKQPQV